MAAAAKSEKAAVKKCMVNVGDDEVALDAFEWICVCCY